MSTGGIITKIRRTVGAVVIGVSIAGGSASALTIDFSGTVTSTSVLGGGVVPGSVTAGDAVSGSITYDPSTPDVQAATNSGVYHDFSSFLSLTIGGNTWTVTGNRIVINDDVGGLDNWQFANGNFNAPSVFTGPGVLDSVLGAAFQLQTFGPSNLVTSDALLGTVPPFDISAADAAIGSLASSNQFSQWLISYDIDRESLSFTSPPVAVSAPGVAPMLVGGWLLLFVAMRTRRQ